MDDRWGAFCNEKIDFPALGTGVVSPLTFAVKDVFDVKGVVPGAGNPDWKRTHPPAEKHAEVIVRLLEQGAHLAGITKTDELMYSLSGENVHYGTPINPNAEHRLPGGSSSGSAVAVAARLVDFALGTDTGGSVRIPASYCGVYGFRPTHGVIPVDGVIPLAPSFDTVGWFARDADTLVRVGRALLADGAEDEQSSSVDTAPPFKRIYLATDVQDLLQPECVFPYQAVLSKIVLFADEAQEVRLAPEGLASWAQIFRVLQGWEVWQTHREWVEQTRPRFGPGVRERFAWCSTLESSEVKKFQALREDVHKRVADLLGEDALLVMPTSPSVAPERHADQSQIEATRSQTLQLCCIAGLSGSPQVSLPWIRADGIPLGLSFVAGRGQDHRLLQYVHKLEKRMKRFFPA
jgi:amidase